MVWTLTRDMLRSLGYRVYEVESLAFCRDLQKWIGELVVMVYANHASCLHVGKSREELLSMCISDLAPAFMQ